MIKLLQSPHNPASDRLQYKICGSLTAKSAQLVQIFPCIYRGFGADFMCERTRNVYSVFSKLQVATGRQNFITYLSVYTGELKLQILL